MDVASRGTCPGVDDEVAEVLHAQHNILTARSEQARTEQSVLSVIGRNEAAGPGDSQHWWFSIVRDDRKRREEDQYAQTTLDNCRRLFGFMAVESRFWLDIRSVCPGLAGSRRHLADHLARAARDIQKVEALD